jgi:hypothetical protein
MLWAIANNPFFGLLHHLGQPFVTLKHKKVGLDIGQYNAVLDLLQK